LKPIVIIGSGGHGREVLQLIRSINQVKHEWYVLGFLVDPEFANSSTGKGLAILGGVDWLRDRPTVSVALGIGRPHRRLSVARRVEQLGNPCPSLIHPHAWLGDRVNCSAGCIIFAHSSLTTEITLGTHVHINLNCNIGHDVWLGSFTSLYQSVSVSGNVRIGEGVECGVGSRLIPSVSVGAWSVIGAGAVLTRSLPANVTAVGVPAKVISSRQAGWHEG
jgi:sugar O-acyltransferase (sialic acid O-acetyltransferase NeuD family)